MQFLFDIANVDAMTLNYKLFAVGLCLSISLLKAHSYVLLTANVDDLKRIARKFLSDSFTDKIAQLVIEAAYNTTDTAFKSVDVSNKVPKIFDNKAESYERDHKSNDFSPVRSQSANIAKQENKKPIPTTTTKPFTKPTQNYKHSSKKRTPVKSEPNTEAEAVTERSSLEFYKTKKHLYKIHPNSIIDIEKIEESDDSSVTPSRKDFEHINVRSDEIEDKTDEFEIDVHKDEDFKAVRSLRKGFSENISNSKSNDISKSDHSDNDNTASDEASTSNIEFTTEKEKNEFDQYVIPNNDKVVATSGPVGLTKAGIGSSDNDSD